MATQVQFRRGTSAWHAGFAGAEGEVTVNTDDFALHVHDGSTAGGHRSGAGLPDIVTAGSATKVQVDVKGRVIARGDLTATDLPDVPPTKVTGLAGQLAAIMADAAMLAGQITAVQTAVTAMQTIAVAAIPLAQKGAANGVVPLNAASQIDPGYLPPMQDQTSRVQVANDAARLLLPVSAGFRIVEVLSSGQKWAINPGADPAVPSNWGSWADSAAGVDSFAGRSGAVVPAAGDYAADQIASVPTGSLTATNVQAALTELDTDAASLAGQIATIQTAIAAMQGTAGVSSFKGRNGAVIPAVGDYAAHQITSAAVGNLTATNVQAALAELDSDAAALAGQIAILQAAVTAVQAAAGVSSFKGRSGVVIPAAGDYAADQITSIAVGTLAATNVQAALAELDAEKLGLPASLPIASPAEGDLITFGDISNVDTPSRTTVGTLFANRILTAPELRGYTELVAAAVSVNGTHTMGGVTAGNVKRFTLTGAVTLTLPTVSLNNNTGVALSTVLVQDATGGRTATFAAPAGETIIWDGGGSQPALATGAGQETTFSFYKVAGSTHWKGVRTHKGG